MRCETKNLADLAGSARSDDTFGDKAKVLGFIAGREFQRIGICQHEFIADNTSESFEMGI